jgi:hypothetical protein
MNQVVSKTYTGIFIVDNDITISNIPISNNPNVIGRKNL